MALGDKPALMSREELAELRKALWEIDSITIDDQKGVVMVKVLALQLCDTALAAHDIYDKAIEEAAQVADEWLRGSPTRCKDRVELLRSIRNLKGTSNG